MSTSLANCRVLLSKQMGDYWASTTTAAGDTGKKTLVDSALTEKTSDWITDECFTLITESGDTSEDDERKIGSLDPNTGTISCRAHTAQIASGTDYEIHRLFSASEKRRALVHAAKSGHIFVEVRDESKTAGNWLRNGDVEKWASSSYPDYWRVSSVTAAKNTTVTLLTRGSASCKLDNAAGYLYTTDTLVPEFRALKGKTVKFKAKVHCDTASCARLAIVYDGTNIEYSEYHPGTSKFCDENDIDHLDTFLEVEKQIDDAPTSIEFRVYHDVAAGTTYVDDLRLTGPTRDKIYIGDLDLAQDKPHQVLQSADVNIYDEPWAPVHNWKVGKDDYLYIPYATSGYRLRIVGINYLNFYDTSDVVGTDWADTIAIDSPQTEILVAEAAIYLCNQMIMPNQTSGESDRWMQALGYWKAELRDRQGRFGMQSPSATIHWR